MPAQPLDAGRITVIRVSSLVVGAVMVTLAIGAAVQPGQLGDLTLGRILLLSAGPVLVNGGVAALPWRRIGRRTALVVLAVQVVGTCLAAVVAWVDSGADRGDVAPVLAMLLVYSALVLPVRAHLAALTLVTTVFVVAASTTDVRGLTIVVAATSIVGTALLAIVGATAIRRALDRSQDSLDTTGRTVTAMRAVAASARSLATADTRTILDAVADSAAEIASGIAGVYVLDEDGAHLSYAAVAGIPDHLVDERFPRDRGLAGAVLDRGETVHEPDYRTSPWAMPEYGAIGLRAAMGTPIRVHDAVHGVLVAGRYTPGGYVPGEVAAFEMLAGHAGQALALSLQIEADRATIERLVELERLKQDFLATVSHELRTPLTVVGGLVETLNVRGDAIKPETRTELLRRLGTNAATLNRIVTDLLDVRALDTGLVATRAPVDLSRLVREIIDRLQPLAADHDLVVDAPGRTSCLGDADLLERVVENLVVNAIRHTPAGTRIEVRVDEAGDTVTCTVSDDGPGIAAADLPHLTDRFVRGGPLNERRHRGLGLGLALADEILRLHHSALDVRSEPGDGAAFSFRLPTAGGARDVQEPQRPTAGA